MYNKNVQLTNKHDCFTNCWVITVTKTRKFVGKFVIITTYKMGQMTNFYGQRRDDE